MVVPWVPLDSTPGSRIFRRPLGITEVSFYWDGVLNGTTDSVTNMHLRITQEDDRDIYSQSNVIRSWVSLKRRFPLIAAEVEEHDSGPHFILREKAIMDLRPDDVTFKDVDSFHSAECFINDILDGPRPLSSQLLSRVYILRRTDEIDQFHVVVVIAHCITDAFSTVTALRAFTDILSSPIEPPYIPLCERVHMFQPLENRLSYRNLPLVKQRWRCALGHAIHVVWVSKVKGGHTLPGNFKESTHYTPAKSRVYVSTFSRQVSSTILSNCRRHGVTLNTACYALSQVAFSRVLSRRYLGGQISEEEWEYRKRQPMHIIGPLNLRSYLNQDWFETGGAGDVGLNISFFRYSLPFMPLGEMSRGDTSKLELVDGAPRFPALMSFDRFLLRCANITAQSQKVFKHPRFADVCTAGNNRTLAREAAMKWREVGDTLFSDDGRPCLSVQSLNPMLSQMGSTLGNLDNVIPLDYPLSPGHPLSPLCNMPHRNRAGYPMWSSPSAVLGDAKRLHVEHRSIHLRARPAHLYLVASSVNRQLQYSVFYDQRVFSEEIVREWVHEVKDATLWYLGQSHGDKTSVQSKL